MFQRKLFPYFHLIFCVFIQVSYQQSFVETTHRDLTFCLQNHTMQNTLQTFWHDVSSDCELEPRRLLAIYSQLLASLTVANEDQCSILLSHHLRKKLITILVTQLEEDFITQSLNNNRELKQILNEVHKIDKRVSQAIWKRVLNEIYLFVDSGEIIEQLMEWNSEEIQVLGLQYLLNEHQMEIQPTENLVSLLTYHVSKLLKSETLPAASFTNLKRFYSRLPQELRSLYDSAENHEFGLLNCAHWEYLYAPRDNGPDRERRTPLTWSHEKNTTDSDGHFIIELNSKGLAAFGNRYSTSMKFLYVDSDQRAVYFWIGFGLQESRWWHVISSNQLFSNGTNQYLIFQSNDTQDLLCATTEYDENRRYVTLLKAQNNMQNAACQWLVKVF